MKRDDIHLEGVGFTESSLQLSFTSSTDVRSVAGAPVVVSRTVVLPMGHPSYADEITSIRDDLVDLVRDIMGDHAEAEIFSAQRYAEAEDGGDEDAGMGEG